MIKPPPTPVGAVVELAEPRHVRVIGQLDLGARGAAEESRERHVLPGQVGGVDQYAALDVDRTRSGDRDAAHLLTAAMPVDLRRSPLDQALRRPEQRGPGLDAGDQLAVGACEPHAHLRST